MSGSVVRRDNYCGIKAVRYLLWTLASGGVFSPCFCLLYFYFCWKKNVNKRGNGGKGMLGREEGGSREGGKGCKGGGREE